MKVKTWLYPLVLIVSTLAVAIALLLPLFNFVYDCDQIHTIIASFGVFTNFAGLDLYEAYLGITGVFASSYLILAFTGLLLSLVLTVLKLCGFNVQKYPLCNKIASGLALVGTIGFVVSAITFICINQYNIGDPTYPDAYKALTGTFALWLAMGGCILGTIASYLSASDIKHAEEASKVEAKEPANQPKQEVEIVVDKPQEKAKAEKKQQAPIIVAKSEKPKKQPAKKAETKKTATTTKKEAKPAVKTQTKKVEAKKSTSKKTATKTTAKKTTKK